MAVRDHISRCRISAYRTLIPIRYLFFLYCIDNVFSAFLYSKVFPCMAPAVSTVQCLRFSTFFFPGIKLHFDILRTLSILVISIIPNLSYCYTRFFFLRFFTVSYCIIYNITSNNFHISFNFRNSIWKFSSIFYCCSLSICNFSNFICTCR